MCLIVLFLLLCFLWSVEKLRGKLPRHRLEGSGGIQASANVDSCGFRHWEAGGELNHSTISRLRKHPFIHNLLHFITLWSIWTSSI